MLQVLLRRFRLGHCATKVSAATTLNPKPETRKTSKNLAKGSHAREACIPSSKGKRSVGFRV